MGRWVSSIAALLLAASASAGPGVDIGQLARDYAALEKRAAQLAAMVLVSFSMPAASLRQLAADAADAGIVLVLNGLHQRSMQQTARIISQIDPHAAAIWQIDPRQFEKHAVQAVPLFVVSDGTDHAAVRGDVSLAYALQQIAGHRSDSKLGNYASQLRTRLIR